MRPRPPFLLRSVAVLAALAPTPTAQEAGFRPLFDGRTLAGWTPKGGPYDGNANWIVEDGELVGREGPNGEGGLLYTEGQYAAFDLRLEAKLDYPFDSGLFVHMTPGGRGAQITLDHREDGEIGAVYSDGFLFHNPEGARLWRTGEWNDLRLRCTGFDMRLEFWLNGEKVTDFRIERPSGDAAPFAATGRIGLQVHAGGSGDTAARFRNLRVRELPLFGEEPFALRPEAELSGLLRASEVGRAAGWRALFNSKDLEGWDVVGEPDRYVVRDGILGFLARGGGGHLATREDFDDFRLRLDFRISPMANSGVFLRAARDGSNPAFSGCEIQILDDFHWEEVTGTKLKPYQFTGGLYGALPPGDRNALRPVGEWNTYEILYRGSRLAVALNGRPLYDVDTLELVPFEGEPFARRAPKGFIGLQHHGAHHIEAETVVQFRNLFVQPL